MPQISQSMIESMTAATTTTATINVIAADSVTAATALYSDIPWQLATDLNCFASQVQLRCL